MQTGEPQTVGVHESSRRQVLRFSASLIHRCRSFVGSINRPSDFESRLADIVKDRHGARRLPADPPPGDPVTRRVAKFFISCGRAAAARCSQRSAKWLRSSADVKMGILLICQAGVAPNPISAGD